MNEAHCILCGLCAYSFAAFARNNFFHAKAAKIKTRKMR